MMSATDTDTDTVIATHSDASEEKTSFAHNFKRDTASLTCFACCDSWAPSKTAVCVCYVCTVCGVSVHAGCRSLALKDYPCVVPTHTHALTHTHTSTAPRTIHSMSLRFPTTAEDWDMVHKVMVDGTFHVQLVHAYDVDVAAGEFVYAVVRLCDVPSSTPSHSHCNFTVKRSNVATMGDNDCVWDSEMLSTTTTATTTSAPTHSHQTAVGPDSSSSVMTIPFTAWPHVRLATDTTTTKNRDNGRDSDAIDVHPCEEVHTGNIEVELWRSGYVSMLDTIIGKCRVPILPLLAHSGVTVERWFGMEDADYEDSGQQTGMVLLRLLFAPAPATRGGATQTGSGGSVSHQQSHQQRRGTVNEREPVVNKGAVNSSECSKKFPQQSSDKADISTPNNKITPMHPTHSFPHPTTPTPHRESSSNSKDMFTESSDHISVTLETQFHDSQEDGGLLQMHNNLEDDGEDIVTICHIDEDVDVPIHPVEEITTTYALVKDTASEDAVKDKDGSGTNSGQSKIFNQRHIDLEVERPLGNVTNHQREIKTHSETAIVPSMPTSNFSSDDIRVLPQRQSNYSTSVNSVSIFNDLRGETSHEHQIKSEHSKLNKQGLEVTEISIPPLISTDADPSVTIPSINSSDDAPTLSATISSWAYDFVYSSSTTHKKKNRSRSPRSRGGNDSASSPRRPHAHLLETAATNADHVTINGESSAASRAREVAARWKDIGEGVGSVYIHLKGIQKGKFSFGGSGNYYVVARLLADPKNSLSMCTPHPTTVVSSSSPPPVSSSGVDLESPFLYTLLDQDEETHTIYSSSSPQFHSSFHFVVPHFSCSLQFILVDATHERKIGSSTPISIFTLLQRQADTACFQPSGTPDKSPRNSTVGSPKVATHDPSVDIKSNSFSRKAMDNYFGTFSFSYANPLPINDKDKTIPNAVNNQHEARLKVLEQQVEELDMCESYTMTSIVDPSKILGSFEACVRFKENYEELFLDSRPQSALQPPEEAMDLDRVGTHFSRVGAVISALGWLADRYGYLMSWEDPLSTSIIMVIFVYCCLFVEAEYALCVPLFLIVVLFTESWANRHFGRYRKRLITPTEDPLESYSYRPVSYLRLAVSGFRNFGRKGAPKTPPPHMTISFLPEGPVGNVHLATMDGESKYHTSTSYSANSARKGGISEDNPFPELQIASFFIPTTLMGAQDVPVPRSRGVHQPLSSNLAGEAITSLMTSLNIVKQEQVLNDTILHNVSMPWSRRSHTVASLISEALEKGDSNTLGMDSSNGKLETCDRDLLRKKRIESYLEEVDVSYVYPILQKPRPIGLSSAQPASINETSPEHVPTKRCTTKPSTKKSVSTRFEPWTSSPAVLKYTLRGSSSGAGGQMMDNTWGYIYVPLSAVAEAASAKKKEKSDRGQPFSYWRSIFGVEEIIDVDYDCDDEVCVWCDVQWTPSFSRTFTSNDYSENIGDLDNPYAVMTNSQDADKEEDNVSDDETNGDDEQLSQLRGVSRNSKEKVKNRPNLNKAQVLLRFRLDNMLPPMPRSLGAAPDKLSGDLLDHDLASVPTGIPGVSSREWHLSRVIQSIVTPKLEKKSSTISTLWNARDHIKFVQNKLGGLVGTLESFKNIFNWTQPTKTLPFYLAIVGIWILTICIPGRYLILAIGLSEFLYEFTPQPEVLPVKTRIYNLLSSIPNDDDLKEVYSSERAALVVRHEEKLRRQRHIQKLNMVQTCLWQGVVGIRRDSRSRGRNSTDLGRPSMVDGIANSNRWDERFLVVQGYRLVWWGAESDVDAGLGPIDEVLLHGHAGITQASPVDIKEMGDDQRLIAVFGRDAFGLPLKRTILCQDSSSCQQLKIVVNSILELNA